MFFSSLVFGLRGACSPAIYTVQRTKSDKFPLLLLLFRFSRQALARNGTEMISGEIRDSAPFVVRFRSQTSIGPRLSFKMAGNLKHV